MFEGKRSSLSVIVGILALLLVTGACLATTPRFVIVSDLHMTPRDVSPQEFKELTERLQTLADEIIALKPAFAVLLGDVGNEDFPGRSVPEHQEIDMALRRIREAGIEIHVAVGNHDVPKNKPEIADIKRCWFASQLPPYPMNSQLDAEKNPATYRRYMRDKQYYYSFNWQGLHIVLVDSTTTVRDAADKFWTISKEQSDWLVQDLCQHTNNPERYPSIIFLHDAELICADKDNMQRPLYHLLKPYAGEHTVRAVFAGHSHFAHYWPTSRDIGIDVYMTNASIHPDTYCEFIVAEIKGGRLTFERKPVPGRKVQVQGADVIFRDIELSTPK